jgi:hypothetical protein
MKREYLATKLQRAFNSLMCRVRRDRELFGHTKTSLSTQDLLELLTEDQVENFSAWAVVPKHPDLILSKTNAMVIPVFQRKFLVTEWKAGKDHALYTRRLEALPGYAPLKK